MNKLEANAIALKRWRTRLKRALTAIDKLERQRKRLETRARNDLAIAPVGSKPPAPKPLPVESLLDGLDKLAPADDLAIPTFLQRRKLDPVAEQIKSEQEETKRKKAQGRIAKMKAKARGDLKKMPLTGKAALEAIRQG
jgi:hypothetical protein